MVFNNQDGKLRTPAQKGVSWNLEDGKLRTTAQKDTGAAAATRAYVMVIG